MLNQSAYFGIKDSSFDNDKADIANKYANRPYNGTGFLAYRDLPELINRFVTGKQALDYGCGAGYSSSILKTLGFDVVGADISAHMLNEARKNYPDIQFYQSMVGQLPFQDNSFDLVLSTFVLFDLPSINSVVEYLVEAKRVLKPGGIFIASTGSEYFHKHNWLTAENDIKANKNIRSGDSYSVKITDADIVFHDYFYTDKDYSAAMASAGMMKLETLLPLGSISDEISWQNEWIIPPYVVYACTVSK